MSNIIKGSGIIYTTGQPNTIPSVGTDAEFAIDVNGVQYAWNRDTLVWDNIGQGIEIASTNGVPVTTPTKFKPRFVVTPDRSLYFYSGSWGKVNPLPSGLFSSSAQVGRTGIYSGSGTLNGLTRVDNQGAFSFRVENIAESTDYRFILNPNNEIFLGQKDIMGIAFAPDPYLQIGANNQYILFDPVGSVSGNSGIYISDSINGTGIQYTADYQDTLKTNDRSIPDVGIIRDTLTASYANNGRNYKVISFSLTTSELSDPVIEDILQDDYDGLTVSATRNGVGSYSLTFNQDIFLDPVTDSVSLKTFILTNNNLSIGGNMIMRPYVEDVNVVRLLTYNATTDTLIELETDNYIFIEIRTYG
jgi:hypothetical protein